MSCAVQQKHKKKGDIFDLDEVKGPVKLRKEVALESFELKEVWGYTQVRGNSKRVVVCTESEDLLMSGKIMSTNTKSELPPHNPRVKVMLKNLSSKAVRKSAMTVIG